jgi:hypothetical protein
MIESENIGLGVIDEFNVYEEGFLQLSIHTHPGRWRKVIE